MPSPEPTASWEDFLLGHTELTDSDQPADAYVVKHVHDGEAKWIAVSDGVMYAQDMGTAVLLGWACQKDVLQHFAEMWHGYQEHNDPTAAAELDSLLEAILQVMAEAYVLEKSNLEPEAEEELNAKSPRWVRPEDIEDDEEAEDVDDDEAE